MPSREEMFYLRGDNQNNTTAQDFLSRDIENLVSHIKENLRLSGFGNTRQLRLAHQRRMARPSPYSNPSRSLSECCESCCLVKSDLLKTNVSCTHRTMMNGVVNVKRTRTDDVDDGPDDPYEMLQDLLRDGGLIKEAVRRLQKGLSPKQRYYSDSEEESTCTPLHLYRNLEV